MPSSIHKGCSLQTTAVGLPDMKEMTPERVNNNYQLLYLALTMNGISFHKIIKDQVLPFMEVGSPKELIKINVLGILPLKIELNEAIRQVFS